MSKIKQDNVRTDKAHQGQSREYNSIKSTSGDAKDRSREKYADKKTDKSIQNDSYGHWNAVGESVVGMSHRKLNPPVCCQDAHNLDMEFKPIIVVCDGAGSSKASELSARELSRGMVRICRSLEDLLIRLLDLEESDETTHHLLKDELARILFKYSKQFIYDIGEQEKREIRDLRTTLLMTVLGERRLFWLRVGDGEIINEVNGELQRVGEAKKGEFANQTVFIGENFNFEDMNFGILDSENTSGIAVMSDGAAEKLVSNDGKSIASRLSEYLDLLRNNKLPREKLFSFLTDCETWKGTSHDDKTLVLCAR